MLLSVLSIMLMEPPEMTQVRYKIWHDANNYEWVDSSDSDCRPVSRIAGHYASTFHNDLINKKSLSDEG